MWKILRSKIKKIINTSFSGPFGYLHRRVRDRKTTNVFFFFLNKNKMSFSLVSDILFMRVGYRRQVKWILIFVKLALCLWLENMKRVSINIPHVRTQRIPPIEIFESFKYFITPCIPNTEKKWISLCVNYTVKRASF